MYSVDFKNNEKYKGYKTPIVKKINSKLTIIIYKPENPKKETIIGLDHFVLREKDIDPIFIKNSTLKKIVNTFDKCV
jgi:hypothetical protein